jgi:hypothetical protein
MEYFEKIVNYFKFFEDIKLFETDDINNKIAVVFYGKENMIHIFDLRPYIEYFPFHPVFEEKSPEEEYIQDNEKIFNLSQSPK